MNLNFEPSQPAADLASLPAHSKISFTAKLVAHCRTASDIPYAAEVAERIGAQAVYDKMVGAASSLEPTALNWFDVLLEARYKSLSAAVLRSGVSQVLEFASGVALRGLAMSRDPKLTYVETDLPEMTREKITLSDDIRGIYGIPHPKNLHYRSCNILSWDEIEDLLSLFKPGQPIAIIHEGLLPYLMPAEKEVVASHVARILREFGGVWISPDFVSMDEAMGSFWRDSSISGMSDSITQQTGRSFEEGCFKTQAEIDQLLTRHGLEGTSLPQIDGTFDLTCLREKPLSDDHLSELTKRLTLMEVGLAR